MPLQVQVLCGASQDVQPAGWTIGEGEETHVARRRLADPLVRRVVAQALGDRDKLVASGLEDFDGVRLDVGGGGPDSRSMPC